MKSIKNLTALLTMASAAAMLSQTVTAQNWETSADLEVFAEQSDNTRLDYINGEEALRSVERINFEAKRVSRTLELEFGAQAEFVQFSQTDLLDDEENQRATLKIDYSPKERVTYSLHGHYDHEDYSGSQNSLLDPESLGNDFQDEARGQYRIDRYAVKPSVSFKATRRATIKAFVEYRESTYDESANLSDYDSTEISGEWSYNLSEARHDHLTLKAGSVQYNTTARAGLNLEATGYPVLLTYERPIGKNHYVAFSAGATQLSFDSGEFEDTTEPLFGLYIGSDKAERRHRYSLAYNSMVRPDSSSRIINSQSIRGKYEYQATRNVRAGITTLIFRNTQAGDNVFGLVDYEDRNYIALEPNVVWDVSRKLETSLRYRYRQLERDDIDEEASDNAITLGFVLKLW